MRGIFFEPVATNRKRGGPNADHGSRARCSAKLPPGKSQGAIEAMLGLPKTRLHPDWQILGPIGPNYDPHIIVDVGAHSGWFFHCWLDWCPQAQVHAFEPYPPSFKAAFQNYGSDPRVRLVQMAVGDAAGSIS